MKKKYDYVLYWLDEEIDRFEDCDYTELRLKRQIFKTFLTIEKSEVSD